MKQVKCVYCKGEAVKAGFRYNENSVKQRYQCNECGRLFIADDGFKKMRFDSDVITYAVNQNGTLEQIAKKVKDKFKLNVTNKTIREWKLKYDSKKV